MSTPFAFFLRAMCLCVALAALLTTVNGCPSKTQTCAVGQAECACTPAGDCVPGLVCVSGRCQLGGSGGSAGGAGGASATGGTGGSVTQEPPPLPSSTFVFTRLHRRGGRQTSVGFFPTYRTHLYAYDFSTRTERLITDFDDDGSAPGGGNFPTISPDRKWIAFTSNSFRRPAGEDAAGVRGSAIWSVSSDGKAFRRLTPTIPADVVRGAPCANDRGCPAHRSCSAGTCVAMDLTITYNKPLWSRDGRTLFFEESWHSLCQPGITQIQYCHFGTIRSVTDNVLNATMSPDGAVKCSGSDPLTLHPQRDSLLIHRDSCATGQAGFHEWSVSATGGLEPVRQVPQTSPFLQAPIDAHWLPDATAVLMVAGQTRKAAVTAPPSNDVRQPFRGGVHTWTEAGGFKRLYEPETDDTDVLSLAVSPTGDVVVEVASGQPMISQLFLFDVKTGKPTDQLTRDGSNASPAW